MRNASRSARTFLHAVAAFIALGLLATSLCAAPTRQQVDQAKAVTAKLTKAGNLYRTKKIKDSAEALREAQAEFESLVSGASPEIVVLTKSMRKNLEKAIQLLSLEGEKFEPLSELPEAGKPGAKPDPAAVGDGISFARQVSPLLVAKCGNCHVNQAKGGFSMATFAALQKGSKDGGTVIQPGSGAGSRLVEVIESGDMPRGGGKISAN